MPFARKVRYSLFGALIVILVIIYVTTGPASTRNSEFYKKTVALMEYRNRGGAEDNEAHIPERPIHRAGGLHYAEGDKHLTPQERQAMEQGKLKGEPPVGPDGEPIMGPVPQSNQHGQRPLIDTDAKLKERLREAETAAKKNADEKYRHLKDIEDEVQRDRELHGEEEPSVKGHASDKMKYQSDTMEDEDVDSEDDDDRPQKKKEKDNKKSSGNGEKGIAGRKKMPIDEKKEEEGKGKHRAEVDKEKGKDHDEKEQTRIRSILAEILAKSPTTIFSKTYCPFSKKAKYILLEAYSILPAPYVVELNEHPDGPALQELLQKTTGRKTVPNVLVSGKSIGGGDETELLWKNGELPARIQQMAGKRVASVKTKIPYGEGEDGR